MNHVEAQVAIYSRLTNRLVAAGAECVVVTSIAGHFCINEFKTVSPLPVVDMTVEVSAALEKRGLKRIGILGTRKVMETRFYGAVAGVEIVPPSGRDLEDVHQAYIAMAASGVATDAQRDVFLTVSERLLAEQGAEAIMLGGTDLALVFDEATAKFPIIDCAGIHVGSIASLALA
jgi:aspartate racemase